MSKAIVYCDDWSCPAAASCALAWGRSREYAAMKPAKTAKAARAPDKDHCASYSFDEPRPWLMLQPHQRFIAAGHQA
jgi:chlorite dismutase